jgi:GH24 family phage-related lysozyme (muramidase)
LLRSFLLEVYMTQHKDLEKSERDAFVCFSRNGVWGTCGFCPRDINRNAYPEFCKLFHMYDHQMNVEQLADMYKRYTK